MLSSRRQRKVGRSSNSGHQGIVPPRLLPQPCHLPCQRRASFRAPALSMAQGLPAAGLPRCCSVTNAGAWRRAQGRWHDRQGAGKSLGDRNGNRALYLLWFCGRSVGCSTG